MRRTALAFLALLAIATSASASIPPSTVLTPPAIERFAFENGPPARPESTAVLHLDRQLRSAAVAAWPLDRLPETRVSDFDFARPLLPQAEPHLSRALRQGYERLERRRASGDEYQDSSNLYAFCGGDPVNCSDPTGEAGIKDTALSLLGWGVGVVESAGEMVVSATVIGTARQLKDKYDRTKRVVSAYQRDGVVAGVKQGVAEWKGASTDVLKSLPVVNTVRQGMGITDAYGQSSFEGGRQVGRTTFSLAGDATLVYGGVKGVQQMRASRNAPASPEPAPTGRPQWLQDVEAGTNYNKARTFDYPYREVYIEKPGGNGYYRLDAYDPLGGEIVSRKMTQFSQIGESTGISYVNELAAKYPAGAKIANVPSSGPLAGQSLRGQLILEVPVQGGMIPQSVINAARARGVVIRDVFGNVY